MAGGIKGDSDLITDINITPMVDVMLVLLVIFMVAAPSLYNSNIKVDLPAGQSGEKTEKEKVTLNLTLAADGRTYLDGQEVTPAQLDDYIKKALEKDPKTDALISADENLKHGAVVKVMDYLKLNQITKVGIAVKGPEQ